MEGVDTIKEAVFTGIIEELGTIRSITVKQEGIHLKIGASLILEDLKRGDSIAVNGCCLTVVDHDADSLSFDVVQETLQKTNLYLLQVNDKINLERSVKLQDRLSGHLVQGHVDGTGSILYKCPLKDHSYWITIKAPHHLLRYIVYKGSIAVDGVSLTVANLDQDTFSFAMIPHTGKMTTLGSKEVDDLVNLEVDLIAKYIEKLNTPLKVNL